MDNYPKRILSHSNGDKAVDIFRNLCPKEWIIHEIFRDYGLDLRIEVVDNTLVTGKEFYIQIKSISISNDEFLSVSIKQSTINYWLSKLRPIAIVGVDIEKREFVFEWLENAYDDYPNYSDNSETIKLVIPTENNSKRFKKDVDKYTTEYFRKLSSEIASIFENTQLSRILFHASELHRLTAYTTIFLLGTETDKKIISNHIYQFMLEFSLHDMFFEDMFELYRTKKSERLGVLNQFIAEYKAVRYKFYKKENMTAPEGSPIAFVPINYSELPSAVHELMTVLDKLIGLLLQALLIGEFIFPSTNEKKHSS